MENNFDHFLITRFNLKKDDWKTDKNSAVVLDKKWLKNRVDLFKKFCLPSVLAQTSKNFKWLIFFEKDSENDLRSLLLQLQEHSFIIPVFLSGYKEFQSMLPSILAEKASKNQWLLTTRLDNDDATNNFFVETLQKNLHLSGSNNVYHFPQGLCLDLGKTFRLASYTYPLNQFVSLLEKKEENSSFKTVLCREHDKWDSSFHLIQVQLKDAWLQVTHHANMANIFKGVPVFSSRLKNFKIEKKGFSWKYDRELLISLAKKRGRKILKL